MSTILYSENLVEILRDDLKNSINDTNLDSISISPSEVLKFAKFFRNDPRLQMETIISLTGVDYIEFFEIVYHLRSMKRNTSMIFCTQIFDRSDPNLPSVSSIWRGADLQEREVFDLMGIRFTNHPNMSRILLWEGFNGHPLRKDFEYIDLTDKNNAS